MCMQGCFALQVLTLWLQYIQLLGTVDISVPGSMHWVFSVVTFAFSSATSGTLSIDCVLSNKSGGAAIKNFLFRLAVPFLTLIVMACVQACR